MADDRSPSEADDVAELINEKLSELVIQTIERLEHLTGGLIAMASRARGVGMNTIPVEAVDNLLAEHARRFMS